MAVDPCDEIKQQDEPTEFLGVMEQFGFDFGNPVYDIDDFKVSVMVHTFENVYGLDQSRTKLSQHDRCTVVQSHGYIWAGGQERMPGEAVLKATCTEDGLQFDTHVRHAKKVRCTKLTLHNLPHGKLIGAHWEEKAVDKGQILSYPGLYVPLVFLHTGPAEYLYFESLDERVQEKRFAIYPDGQGLTLELIHEALGSEMGCEVTVPPWRVGRCSDPKAIIQRHLKRAEKVFGLAPWDTRSDVPDWARRIALVAILHGGHWTGYVFNTYDEMLETLQWITQRIDGRHVVANLPGWEGRYYWDYGNYRPDPRLGGPEGFRRLVDGSRKLGVRLQLMVGTMCANRGLENFEQWGNQSYIVSVGGWRYQGNKPDWDLCRTHDPGWQAWLNPGAPAWQNRLFEQITGLMDQYGMDAFHFDTPGWINDANHSTYEGLQQLVDRLREHCPTLLASGEGYYVPLIKTLAVSGTYTHDWLPKFGIEFFAHYNRAFDYSTMGDPSRNSTGTYEMGYFIPFRVPELARHIWPAVSFVDGTVEEAPDKVEAVIDVARQYVKHYL